MNQTGIFVTVALVEFALIIFLYLSLRHQKQETKDQWLATRRVELRVPYELDKSVLSR
jgi:hypothetical protein